MNRDSKLTTDTAWIVFGDDWGAHPSTTQHLMLNMPASHQVIWVDSIGMRTPKVNVVDARRAFAKALSMFSQGKEEASRLYEGTVGQVRRISPRVVPWHMRPIFRRLNSKWLKENIEDHLDGQSFDRTYLLAANPVVAYYLDAFDVDKVIYLRLDDYSEYPGCDPIMVKDSEELMFERSDIVVATARALLPAKQFQSKGKYLPQGVQVEAFDSVPTTPPKKPVLGFFGSIAEWLDFSLIEAVATQAPDWTLEFIGKPDFVPPELLEFDNIKILDPVPFASLPVHIKHWAAAWIPFKINELTVAVNPLKVREYLAAGLPTHCTPLPEVVELEDDVCISASPDTVVAWMRDSLASDSVERRRSRRLSMEEHSWSARAQAMLGMISGKASDKTGNGE
jgi:hypothetical protein